MKKRQQVYVVLMLIAMLLIIVQPFLELQVARAATTTIEPNEIVTGTVSQVTPNIVDIMLGEVAGVGGWDSGDMIYTAYLKFNLPANYDYSNAKLSLTPLQFSDGDGDITSLTINIGSSDDWIVTDGSIYPLSTLPSNVGIEKAFSKPAYSFNNFDFPILLPIGDLLTEQNINDIGSNNIITLILSSPNMKDDYAVFGSISLVDFNTSPQVKHTVSFETDGGSAVPSQSVVNGGMATMPEIEPTKAGYTFEGWYKDAGYTQTYDFNSVITKATTIYAKWNAQMHTVSFEVDGGSAVSNQFVTLGGKAKMPEIEPTKAGYTFGGWYTDAGRTQAYDFTSVITEATTIYAKWNAQMYTVSFEVDGGSEIANQSVAYGGKATMPEIEPTKAGYTFGGWYKDAGYTQTYDFTSVITEAVTIYAKWNAQMHTVSFEVDGGSAVSNQSVAHGEKASEPTPAPTKAGYTFGGWYTDAGRTQIYNFNSVITEAVTIYAKWNVQTYTVSFEVDGGSAVSNQSVAHGEKASLPTQAPTKAGYTFEGWYTDVTHTDIYDFNKEITANTTIYAKWKPLKYTVSFEVDGGSAVSDQSIAHGGKATMPQVEPTKAGYTFGGWYTDAGYTQTYDFNSNITGNITIYAKWNAQMYTVSFEVDGGSAISNQSVAHGGKATMPQVEPTKAGYTFGGWYTDAGHTQVYDFTNVITENTTIYAKWNAQTYTVSFEVDGGSAVSNQSVAHGEKASLPTPAPTKAGYTFGGWYTDVTHTEIYDFNNENTANTTIYAKWEPLKYTVSFEVDGGNAILNQSVAHGEKASEPNPAPTKAGYTFGGWYTSSTLEKLFDFESSSITRNMTIYAKWISNVSPPTSNNSSSTSSSFTPTTNTERIVVEVEGEGGINLSKTPITRTTMPDGVIKDHVSMSEDIAKETIEKAKQLRNDIARIIIPDTNDKVSEIVIEIPKSSIVQLSSGNIKLEMATANVVISIANLSNFYDDLYFRLVPIKTSELQHRVEERIVEEDIIKNAIQGDKVHLIGRPMTIETNMQNRPVTLTLPLPKNITQEQLDHLAIFIEHSDGTKELMRGKVVDYQKDMQGLQFEVQKFSTFSMLYLPENVVEPTTHIAYIRGNADGTFRPNAFVTRAQMASMFARQLTVNAIPTSKATFTDIVQHDAKDAIEFVKNTGLFNGVTEASFQPNGFISRAQMAVVAARWIEKHCVNNPNPDFCKPTSQSNVFTDVSNNHWAVEAIHTVNTRGIMTGTTRDTFDPEGYLTRAQAVKILNHLFERQVTTENQIPIFKDVPSDHWAFNDIQEAAVKHSHSK
ncbi:InlB B-repeat-containing protein [Lysinibacillus fusiformis]|uniref:InlB B-repeat-containing protein n=1 Tax=Lysinibacillus fusiformis TaxID=28031 RepID=UPI002D781AD7|nr:InlB B-repeat-containing protein [Lysinibacillus fusiformis]WRS98864.1 InlB B-repeat-containing protein [Lysinibacillus fusiformis]